VIGRVHRVKFYAGEPLIFHRSRIALSGRGHRDRILPLAADRAFARYFHVREDFTVRTDC